jgi:hypothetical protein
MTKMQRDDQTRLAQPPHGAPGQLRGEPERLACGSSARSAP